MNQVDHHQADHLVEFSPCTVIAANCIANYHHVGATPESLSTRVKKHPRFTLLDIFNRLPGFLFLGRPSSYLRKQGLFAVAHQFRLKLNNPQSFHVLYVYVCVYIYIHIHIWLQCLLHLMAVQKKIHIQSLDVIIRY